MSVFYQLFSLILFFVYLLPIFPFIFSIYLTFLYNMDILFV